LHLKSLRRLNSQLTPCCSGTSCAGAMATESRHEPHRLQKGGKAEEAEIQQYHSHTREYTYHRNISANIPRSLECLCAWIHLTALSRFSLELGGRVARGLMSISIDGHIHHTLESSRQMKSLIQCHSTVSN
jgi:hypothetical protein